jgi:hypothetical protein
MTELFMIEIWKIFQANFLLFLAETDVKYAKNVKNLCSNQPLSRLAPLRHTAKNANSIILWSFSLNLMNIRTYKTDKLFNKPFETQWDRFWGFDSIENSF